MPAVALCLAGVGAVLLGAPTPGFILIGAGLMIAVIRGLYW